MGIRKNFLNFIKFLTPPPSRFAVVYDENQLLLSDVNYEKKPRIVPKVMNFTLK